MKKLSPGLRILSAFLALVMVLGLVPASASKAKAASNMEGGFEGQEADVFTAMGFDTTQEPAGYDAQTVDNPYGKDKLPGNQIFEMLISANYGTFALGDDNNAVGIKDMESAAGTGLPGTDVPFPMFASAPADFDNDGLAGEVVYVGYDTIHYGTWSQKASLQLAIYDGKTGTMSGKKTISSAMNPGQVITSGGGNYAGYDYAWQNLLQVTAGDYDGDGISEIAVYVGEDGNNRVEIYKYMRTDATPENGWQDLYNWNRVWSHVVNNADNLIDNMVSLASGDFNRDGVDDLGIASGRVAPHGRPFSSMSLRKSDAVILWGARNDMLQTNSKLDLNEGELGELGRVSLLFEDLDGDGYKDLIATGQPISDLTGYMTSGAVSNTTRSIITYTYDGLSQMVITYSGNLKPVDGSMATNDDGESAWQSANGFDGTYLSSPLMRTNAAVFKGEGLDYAMLYLDSCMYECVEGQLNLKYSLDDEAFDGQNKLPKAWLSTSKYTEFGAASADLNGNGFHQLYTSFYGESSVGTSGHVGGFAALAGQANGILTDIVCSEAGNAVPCYRFTPVDVDMDTVIIRYTGNHYLTYSDPKVLAIIAAAPYFEDVDVICDYDYAWQNTTSYSTTSGSGGSDLVAVDLEVGAYIANSNTIGFGLIEIETSVNFTLEWEKETTTTTEYTLTFETSQDEDAVAFFSVPTENYVYEILTPDGEGGYISSEDIISNTFQPVYQILTLDYYESIRGDYPDLPAIAGVALTSTPGDPASYPSSTSGYDVIAQWNKDPAGIGFGNGAISQEITITREETESYNMGAALDFQMGGGVKYDGLTYEVEVVGGAQFSLNPTGGWSTIDITGTTFSGTVTNMPLEFQDYGYYYNWKIFAYNYRFGNDNSVPVLTYVVNDVTEPPLLPTDFQQDVERTTSDTNILTWTYEGAFSKFIIYKYYDFPVGGGLQVAAEYEKGQVPFVLRYDEAGEPYKEYYFADTNLAPYCEYRYAIQVERLEETPPLSAPSGILVARTKAADGNPVNHITESDGKDDGKLLLYPDKNGYLTVLVTGPEGEAPGNYYTTVQYQWQKQERGAWVDIINETNQTLTIANAGSSTAGTYRCRVNVLTKSDATAITSYTDAVELGHSKRSTYFKELYVADVTGGGIELYAQVVNAHTDSATIPNGSVSFNFVHTQTGRNYQFHVNLNTAGIVSGILDDTLPAGMYKVYARYSGSFTFKSCSDECIYMSEIESGYNLDAPVALTYGDGATLTFQSVVRENGRAVGTPTFAESYSMGIAITTSLEPLANAKELVVTPGQAVAIGKGNYYVVDAEGEYRYFYNPWTNTSVVNFVDNYIVTSFYSSYVSRGEKDGEYKLAENTPGGYQYIVYMVKDGVTASAVFTVEKRAITLQLPHQKAEENTGAVAPYIRYGALEIISGSWAPCDMTNGVLKSNIADQILTIGYYNTAGTKRDGETVLDQCGYYVTKSTSSPDNYRVTLQDGSMTVIGGSKEVTVGVRDFENQDVGTLYAISPDYAYTRSEITDEDKLVQTHGVGTRLVFNAVPDQGYEVYDWYINGVPQGVTKSSISHVMLNEATTVEVQFAIKKNSLIFGVAGATEGGTLTCSDPDITSSSVVLANAYFTFTAKAKEGYHFKEWRYTEQGRGSVYNDEDYGKAESQFQLLMPSVSCSLYAVFERDTYTLTYEDLTGADGLTAWYMGNLSGDTTVQEQRITVESGSPVPGGTVVVVEPKMGYKLDDQYNFVSSGSQGVADYEAGTYTLTMEENTHVTGYTLQEVYDLTLRFGLTKTHVAPEGAQILYTINGEEKTFTYAPGKEELVIRNVAGGSTVTAQIVYPDYYTFDGWTLPSHKLTATVTNDPAAQAVRFGGEVTKGMHYYYDARVGNTTTRYFFVAHMDGVVRFTGANATIHTPATRFTVPALGSNEVITAHMTEKPVYQVTLADITGKGTYSFQLPQGAKVDNSVVTCHENDPVVIMVVPEQKWTVSYWQISDGVNTMKTRATSLKYQFPTLTANYTFTPIFSATTYNTISWPTINQDRCGLVVSPESGYLSSVTSGSDFKFRLVGNSVPYVDVVMANGNPFEAASTAEKGYAYTYQDVNGARVYTISNVTENQVLTLSMKELGIKVNGKDISVISGSGWTFDGTKQLLTLSKPNLTVSGSVSENAKDNLYALTIKLADGINSLSFSNLTVDSKATAFLTGGDEVILSVAGTNTLHVAAFSHITGDLTLRGNGELLISGAHDSNPMIHAEGNLNVGSSLHLTVEQKGKATAMLAGGNLTVGGSKGYPIVRVTQSGTTGRAIDAMEVTEYSGEMTVTGRDYAIVANTLDVYNTIEMRVTNTASEVTRSDHQFSNLLFGYMVCPYSHLYRYAVGGGEPVTKTYFTADPTGASMNDLWGSTYYYAAPMGEQKEELKLSVVVNGTTYTGTVSYTLGWNERFFFYTKPDKTLDYNKSWSIPEGQKIVAVWEKGKLILGSFVADQYAEDLEENYGVSYTYTLSGRTDPSNYASYDPRDAGKLATVIADGDSVKSLTLDNLTFSGIQVDAYADIFINGDNYLIYNGGTPLATTSSGSVRLTSTDGTGSLTLQGKVGMVLNDLDLRNLKAFTVFASQEVGQVAQPIFGETIDVGYYAKSGTNYVVSNYLYGWLANAGESATDAQLAEPEPQHKITAQIDPRATDHKYFKAYPITRDATIDPVAMVYDLSKGGMMEFYYTRPAVNGLTYDRVSGADGIVLYNSQGDEVELTLYADGFNPVRLFAYESEMKELPVGEYLVVVNFQNGDKVEMPLSIVATQSEPVYEGAKLYLNTPHTEVTQGAVVKIRASYEGEKTPSSYQWFADGALQGEQTDTFTFIVPDDAKVGDTFTIGAVARFGSMKLAEAELTLTVANAAADIQVTCEGEVPSGDGSYTLYHTTADGTSRSWNFRAVVVMASGETNTNVVWSLWGAQLRTTAINAATGVLTVSPLETGTNGTLEVLATYTNTDGTTFTKRTVIYLATDAFVAYENEEPAKGEILSAVYDGKEIPATGAYVPAGSTVTFTAEPTEGYRLAGWFVNGRSIENQEGYTAQGNTLSFTTKKMTRVVVTARFEPIPVYTVTFEGLYGGTVTAQYDGIQVHSGDAVPQEAKVIFTAAADELHTLEKWIINGTAEVAAGDVLPVSITQDVDVKAIFKVMDRTLTVTADEGGNVVAIRNGNLLPGTDGVYNITALDSVQLIATADLGMEVDAWIVNGKVAQQGGSSLTIPAGEENVTVEVTFKAMADRVVTINTNSYLSGTGTVTIGDLTVPMSSSEQIALVYGGNLSMTANPDPGNEVLEWVVEGAEYILQDNTLTILDVRENVTVNVKFVRKEYTVTLEAENGTIQGEYVLTLPGNSVSGVITDSAAIPGGASITLTMTPEEGYVLSALAVNGQTVDVTENTYYIEKLTEDMAITATFRYVAEDTFYTVTAPKRFLDGETFSGNLNLTVVPDGISTREETEDTVTAQLHEAGAANLTFAPASGYMLDLELLKAELERAIGTKAQFCITLQDGNALVALEEVTENLDFTTIASPFVKETEMVTVTIRQGENGKLTMMLNGTALEGVACVPKGSGLIAMVQPDEHYELSGLWMTTSNGTTAFLEDVTEEDVLVVNSDVTFQPVFVPSEYLVTVEIEGNGTVLVNGTAYAHGHSFYAPVDSILTVTENPDSYNILSSLTVIGGTETEEGYKVTGDITVKAVYAQEKTAVTYNAPVGGTLKVTDSEGNTVLSGDMLPVGDLVVVTANADDHYGLTALTVGSLSLMEQAQQGYVVFKVDPVRGNHIAAQFAKVESRIYWETTDGTVAAVQMPEGETVRNGQYLPVGSSFKLITTPKSEDYLLQNLSITGAAKDDATGWYTVGQEDISINAYFCQMGAGTVQMPFAINGLDETVYYGDQLTLSADDAQGEVTFEIIGGTAARIEGNRFIAVGVGKVTVQATSVAMGYEDRTTTRTVTVYPRVLTATAEAKSRVYDGTTAVAVSITLSNVIAGDNVFARASGETVNADAGQDKLVYVHSLTLEDTTGFYTLEGTGLQTRVTITPKTVETLTATAEDKIYDGTKDAAVMLTSQDILPGDVADVTILGTGAFAAADAGVHTVTAEATRITGSKAGNYCLAEGVTAETEAQILPATVLFEVGTTTFLYDGQIKEVPVTATLNGKAFKDFTVTYSQENPSNVGTYEVTVTLHDSRNYTGAPAPFAMEIQPAEQGMLVISGMPGLVDYSKVFTLTTNAAPDAVVTWSTSDETVATVTQDGTVTIMDTDREVTITAHSRMANHNDRTASVTFTPVAKQVTFRLGGLNPTYNGQVHAVTVTPSIESMTEYTVIYTDEQGNVVEPVDAGIYYVTVQTNSRHYAGQAVATLTVKKAQLTATVSMADWVYGEAIPAPTFTVSAEGLQPVFTYAGTALVDGKPYGAGEYTVTATFTGNNYETLSVSDTFTVSKAILTVKAQSATREYGKANPAFLFDVEGFVNGDGLGSLLVMPIAATAAEAVSPVGTYPITVTGGRAANYDFAYVDGELTVVPAQVVLTVIAPSAPVKVGDEVNLHAFVEQKEVQVRWVSGDEAVATVDENGIVSFLIAGSVEITAYLQEENYTAQPVTVTVTAEKRNIALTPVSTVFAFNGEVQSVEFMSVGGFQPVVGQNVTVSYVLNSDPSVKVFLLAGTYTVTYEICDPVYQGSGTFTATINRTPSDEEDLCPSRFFIDVDKDAWYHEAVDFAVANGLMNGTSLTTFEPFTTTSRAMIVTILYRLEGEPEVTATTFEDVPENQWYTDAVSWAEANGIVEGYGNGKFGPNNPVTREQIATILYRYAGFKGYDITAQADLSCFEDADTISRYAVEAMGWARAMGLINGRPGGIVDPRNGATRCEVAQILMRFCLNISGVPQKPEN